MNFHHGEQNIKKWFFSEPLPDKADQTYFKCLLGCGKEIHSKESKHYGQFTKHVARMHSGVWETEYAKKEEEFANIGQIKLTI